MARLTADQKAFIARHRIPLHLIGDASGLGRREYYTKLKAEGKYFAYGVSKCSKGHSLASRRGECIQCKTAIIAYSMRHIRSGFIYIAGSMQTSLIKIGVTGDPLNRIYLANLVGYEYAGACDWRVLYWAQVDKAGECETIIHRALSVYQTAIPFVRNGINQTARECFRCDYAIARKKANIAMLLNDIHPGDEWEEADSITNEYNLRSA